MNPTADRADCFDPATDFVVPPLRPAGRAAAAPAAASPGNGTPTPGTAEFERLSAEIHDLIATIVRQRNDAAPAAIRRAAGT